MNDRDIVSKISAIIGKENVEDDCARYIMGDYSIVATTDMLHEKTDFPSGISDWQIGWMSAAVTLSDIASTGAKPLFILLAAGLTESDTRRIEDITRGAKECSERYGAKLLGGDIDSHDELTIVTTGIGKVSNSEYVSRKYSGNERTPKIPVGSLVCVCGELGVAQRGLDIWKDGLETNTNLNSNLGDKERQELFTALCQPIPKVNEGISIGRSHPYSMMDISDGLALSLYDLSRLNDCGFEIEKRAVFDESKETCRNIRADSFENAFYGAGDFGLLYICSEECFKKANVGYVIGSVTEKKGVFIDGAAAKRAGYSHEWIL